MVKEDDPCKAISNSYLNKSLVFRICLSRKANPLQIVVKLILSSSDFMGTFVVY